MALANIPLIPKRNISCHSVMNTYTRSKPRPSVVFESCTLCHPIRHGLTLGRNSTLSPKIVKWLNDVERTNVTALHRRTSQCSKRVHLDDVSLAVRDENIRVPFSCWCGWRKSIYLDIFLIPLFHVVYSMLSHWLVNLWLINQPPLTYPSQK